MDPDIRYGRKAVNAALPAVIRNGLSDEWVRVVRSENVLCMASPCLLNGSRWD
jgi:hypothetical protein